jgi:spore germination cell wall hydrolase CwlJ-like protein
MKLTKLLAGILICATVLCSPGTLADTNKTQQILCLAKNIYFEARGEPHQGKLAVAQVTLNRTKHWQFRGSVCSVVYQPRQFSWTLKPALIKDYWAWQEAKQLAHDMLTGKLVLEGFDALYFHTKQIKPKWKKHKKAVTVIGNHVFYK